MNQDEIVSIPFNKPDIGEKEHAYLKKCLDNSHLSGDGPYTKECHKHLQGIYGSTVLLMNSCTAALEAAAILTELRPGDEVIMPSFTFVSTANAVVLRGAVPVFVDICSDNLNIDSGRIMEAITDRTRAIIPVHYAGISCEMDKILAIAEEFQLTIIEDAAQCFGSTFKNRPLGTIGRFGCISFHDTKNIIAGEGGAIIVNDPELVDRAYFIREKGTNRTQFLRGIISKYEWLDIGSSYVPSDLQAAILLAQMERSEEINRRRIAIWNKYHSGLEFLEEKGFIKRPQLTAHCQHNGHIYYILGRNQDFTRVLISQLKTDGIGVTSHFVPLHSSPGGRHYGRNHGDMKVTDMAASTIVRLPVFYSLSDVDVDRVIDRVVYHASRIST